jgi:hypothetical protein
MAFSKEGKEIEAVGTGIIPTIALPVLASVLVLKKVASIEQPRTV